MTYKIKIIVLVCVYAVLSFAAPAFALSCVQPSLERDLQYADTAFEGHVVKIERRFDDGKYTKNPNYHFQKATVYVDRPIKGNVAKGQDVPVIIKVWGSLDQSTQDWVESEKEYQKGLFVFSPSKDEIHRMVGEGETVFDIGMCGMLVWEATPENIKLVEDWAKKQ